MDKLYRLLIVDDEYHVVDWLAELFTQQEALPLELYRAHLVREALRILEQVKIDVVLSDIKMPGMDGFDLADRIVEQWPRAKIIFLTGYHEFEYAYRANRYGNISFLLKTEDDDVIFRAVQEAAAQLEEENRHRQLVREHTGLQRTVSWQMQKCIWTEWLEKPRQGMSVQGAEDTEAEAIQFPFSYEKMTVVCCVRIREGKQSPLERERLAVSLQQLWQEMLYEKGDIGILDMDETHFLAAVQSRTEKPILLYMREMLDEFSAAALEELGAAVFITMYEEAVPFASMREQYEFLKLAALDVADTGDLYGGRILSVQERAAMEAAGNKLLGSGTKAWLEALPDLLEQGKREEFFRIFDKIHGEVILVPGRHYYPAIEVFQFFSLMYLSFINRKGLVEKLAFQTALARLVNLQDFADWKEAFDYLRDLGELLFVQQAEAQKDRNAVFVENIKDFVRANLKEDLSLTDISRQMHYNPSYISRMFKQLAGKNLSEYILEEKIAYAKRRLLESEDTVLAIAKEIGFESPQYFSVVFRRQTGMAPGEYRHRKREA